MASNIGDLSSATTSGTATIIPGNDPAHRIPDAGPLQLFATFQPGDRLRIEFSTPIAADEMRNLGMYADAAESEEIMRVTLFAEDSSSIEYLWVPCSGSSRFHLPFSDLAAIEFVATATARLLISDVRIFEDDFPQDIAKALAALIRAQPARQILCGRLSGGPGSRALIEGDRHIQEGTAINVRGQTLVVDKIRSVRRSDGLKELVFRDARTSGWEPGEFGGFGVLPQEFTGEPVYLAIPIRIYPVSTQWITPAIVIPLRHRIRNSSGGVGAASPAGFIHHDHGPAI